MKTPFHRLLTFFAAVITLLAAQVVAQTPSPIIPSDPHEHVREILQRPLYQRWQLRQEQETDSSVNEAARRQAERLTQWIRDFIEWLFRRAPLHGSWTPPTLGAGLKTLFWVIAWSAIILFVVALIVLIVRLVHATHNPAATGNVLSREQVAVALDQGDALALGGGQWLDEAGRLAAEKNFRAMYRALYLALLSGLHANGKIDFNRHYTNWTYVRRFRGQSSEREVFSALTDLFDSVWYGLKESTHPDLAGLKQQVQQLIAPAGAGETHAN
jgi:hypothetical protein